MKHNWVEMEPDRILPKEPHYECTRCGMRKVLDTTGNLAPKVDDNAWFYWDDDARPAPTAAERFSCNVSLMQRVLR